MKQFADIILPLALEKNYTYGIPVELQGIIQVGQRVEVQLGRRKVYSGIVKRIHADKPELYNVKPIRAVLDTTPVVSPTQLALWEWMASYYVCTEGEVMNAAMPANLKLESETFITLLQDEIPSDIELNDDEFLVMQALEIKQMKRKESESKSTVELSSTNDSLTLPS